MWGDTLVPCKVVYKHREQCKKWLGTLVVTQCVIYIVQGILDCNSTEMCCSLAIQNSRRSTLTNHAILINLDKNWCTSIDPDWPLELTVCLHISLLILLERCKVGIDICYLVKYQRRQLVESKLKDVLWNWESVLHYSVMIRSAAFENRFRLLYWFGFPIHADINSQSIKDVI